MGKMADLENIHQVPPKVLGMYQAVAELLEDYNIPLPPQDRVEFLAKQKDIGPGDPFVGGQCSYFVAW